MCLVVRKSDIVAIEQQRLKLVQPAGPHCLLIIVIHFGKSCRLVSMPNLLYSS